MKLGIVFTLKTIPINRCTFSCVVVCFELLAWPYYVLYAQVMFVVTDLFYSTEYSIGKFEVLPCPILKIGPGECRHQSGTLVVCIGL